MKSKRKKMVLFSFKKIPDFNLNFSNDKNVESV